MPALDNLKPSDLQQGVGRMKKASERLATQTKALINEFTTNHKKLFAEAGTSAAVIAVMAFVSKDAVNTIMSSQKLEDAEGIAIMAALGAMKQGASLEEATTSLDERCKLLVEVYLLAVRFAKLADATHQIKAGFDIQFNADGSAATSDIESKPIDDSNA